MSKQIHSFGTPIWPTAALGPREEFVANYEGRLDAQINEIRRSYGLPDVKREPVSKPNSRFKLLDAKSVANLRPIPWRVKGVMPETGIAAIYGPSGSGKSFLAMDLALRVAKGDAWFQSRVTPCPVVYVALEGEGGLSNRLSAYRRQHGEIVGEVFFLAGEPCSLLQPNDVRDLARSIQATGLHGGVVVIDTLNRAAPGMDENSSADMGRVIAATKQLQSRIGGLIILVHHTGKDASKGMRGHSSLHAALDAAIEVARNGDQREWKVAKAKDGEDGLSHSFRLDVVELGFDEDGDSITSCVITPESNAANNVRNARIPKGGNQKIVWDRLRELLQQSTHFGKAGAHAMQPCVELEETILRVRDGLPTEPKRKTERARQAVTGLVSSGLVHLQEGWLWID